MVAEGIRLGMLRAFEVTLEGAGYPRVAGVDEAGRGALAGPVLVAAYIPHPDRIVPGVDDSKVVPEVRRAALAPALRDAALAWSVVRVEASEIDRTDILAATRRAMREALLQLAPAPAVAVVDAVVLRDLPFPVLSIVKADRIAYAVAAASILAKVARDEILCQFDQTWPWYGFAEHKGYGAPRHLASLNAHGPCPEHRLSFRGVLPVERRAA